MEISDVSDDAFLEQLERLTLPPELFDHYGHLRLAWLCLRRHPLKQAIEKVATGILAYADSLGEGDMFHRTLTEAIVRVMASRMAAGDADTLSIFLAENLDLVMDMQAVIGAHYSDEVLRSAQARARFVAPDRAPLGSPGAG